MTIEKINLRLGEAVRGFLEPPTVSLDLEGFVEALELATFCTGRQVQG